MHLLAILYIIEMHGTGVKMNKNHVSHYTLQVNIGVCNEDMSEV